MGPGAASSMTHGMRSLQNRQNIQSIQQQIHNIVYDRLTTSKTSLITQDCSSSQAKAKLKLCQAKAKLELRRHIITVGSCDRIEEGVNDVVSLPAALL
jgi:hypothetical protein